MPTAKTFLLVKKTALAMTLLTSVSYPQAQVGPDMPDIKIANPKSSIVSTLRAKKKTTQTGENVFVLNNGTVTPQINANGEKGIQHSDGSILFPDGTTIVPKGASGTVIIGLTLIGGPVSKLDLAMFVQGVMPLRS